MSQIVKEIREKLEQFPQIKAVSFDVFDTLLFRTFVVPDRVFWYMYRKNTKLFPAFTSIGDWVSSRKIAEQEARRIAKETYGHTEVSLEDIYRCLPTAYSNRMELMQLEFECECEVGVLNTEISDFLKLLQDRCQKGILLISDMYLSSAQIASVLRKKGMHLEVVKKIYVSSEAKCSKKDGGLFRVALEKEGLAPDELLHIGDNLQSDIGAAKKLGIHTCYYNYIAEREFKYPFLLWEREFFSAPLCEELYLTRLLAGNNDGEIDSCNFFFTFGKMIMGPFFTCAAEWVIEEALRNNVRVIRPFMREGKFLTKLLCAAAENREIELSIEPIYISRMAAYSSRLSEIMPRDISTMMAGANVSLRNVLRQLQIEDLAREFQQYMDEPLSELRILFDDNGKSVYDTIYEYLKSNEILEEIRNRNCGKKEIFLKYLQQAGLSEPAITVDIGWNGTTMNAVYQTLKDIVPAGQLLQLLFCSSKEVAKNSVDGCMIKGFVGNYGGLQGKFKRIFIPIFEMFSLCEEGPTIGYRYEGQMIVPIIDKNVFSQEWIHNISEVQRGIMAFQKEFFKMSGQQAVKIDVKKLGVQALSIVERAFSYPLLQEAQQLVTAELDQNIGIEKRNIPVLEEDMITEYQELGMDHFFALFRNRQRSVTWYQALQTLDNPLFYLQSFIMQNAQYGKYALTLLTKYVVEFVGDGQFVFVYCGQASDKVMVYLKAMNAIDKIAGIVSADEYLQGVVYCGIEISAMDTHFDTNLYFIPEMNQGAYNLVKKQILSMHGTDVRIIGHFEKDEVIWNYDR